MHSIQPVSSPLHLRLRKNDVNVWGGGGMNPRNGQVNATAARKLHMSRINLYRRLVIHPWQILKIPYAIFRSRLPAAINYLP